MTAGCRCRTQTMSSRSTTPSGGTAKLPLLEPIYPLTAGLTNTSLRKVIAEALTRLPAFA